MKPDKLNKATLICMAWLLFSYPEAFAQNSYIEAIDKAVLEFEVILNKENGNKQEKAMVFLPDSIHEETNLGYKREMIKWYYLYNHNNQKDSVVRYYYNDKNEFQNVTEYLTYNADGTLKRFLRRQKLSEPSCYFITGDTIVVDYFIEESTYSEKKLIRKLTISFESNCEPDTSYSFHQYDIYGRIVRDSIVGSDSFYTIVDYQYYPEGYLQTRTIIWPQAVRRHEYYYSEDSFSRKTEIVSKLCYSCSIDDLSELFPDYSICIDELFDGEGRRISMTREEIQPELPREKVFMINYSYTDFGEIEHMVYFIWKGTYEEGLWEEIARADYSYGEHGNLVVYEKIFFDERTFTWELANRLEYFYTEVFVLPVNSYSGENLFLFPNPAGKQIHIINPFSEGSKCTIYTLSGILIIEKTLEKGDNAFDVSHLRRGMYLLVIDEKARRITGRFVKK